jgi:hypothetical protein
MAQSSYNDGLPRRPKPEVCEIEGCDRPANVPGTGRGWCQAHYRRWQNWGDVNAPIRRTYMPPGDEPGYVTMHVKVSKARGRASDHVCIDCGERAKQWSYDHTDDNGLIGSNAGRDNLSYSLDVDRYEPRCVSCHAAFDKRRRDGSKEENGSGF